MSDCKGVSGFRREDWLVLYREMDRIREENARLNQDKVLAHKEYLALAGRFHLAEAVVDAARKMTHRSTELFEAMKAHDEATSGNVADK